jgi:hypothetical protein
LILAKKDLDKAFKDDSHQKFPPGFKCEIILHTKPIAECATRKKTSDWTLTMQLERLSKGGPNAKRGVSVSVGLGRGRPTLNTSAASGGPTVSSPRVTVSSPSAAASATSTSNWTAPPSTTSVPAATGTPLPAISTSIPPPRPPSGPPPPSTVRATSMPASGLSSSLASVPETQSLLSKSFAAAAAAGTTPPSVTRSQSLHMSTTDLLPQGPPESPRAPTTFATTMTDSNTVLLSPSMVSASAPPSTKSPMSNTITPVTWTGGPSEPIPASPTTAAEAALLGRHQSVDAGLGASLPSPTSSLSFSSLQASTPSSPPVVTVHTRFHARKPQAGTATTSSGTSSGIASPVSSPSLTGRNDGMANIPSFGLDGSGNGSGSNATSVPSSPRSTTSPLASSIASFASQPSSPSAEATPSATPTNSGAVSFFPSGGQPASSTNSTPATPNSTNSLTPAPLLSRASSSTVTSSSGSNSGSVFRLFNRGRSASNVGTGGDAETKETEKERVKREKREKEEADKERKKREKAEATAVAEAAKKKKEDDRLRAIQEKEAQKREEAAKKAAKKEAPKAAR